EPTTALRIASAAERANAGVAQACCGADGICGTAGDELLAGLGWDLGSCPNVESGACTAAIGGVADVPPCFTCVDATAVGRVASWSFGPQGPAPAPSPVGTCRRALGKVATRFLVAESRALAACWDGRLRGAHANPCPDPGDGKATAVIAAARAKMTAAVCAACGGADRGCGGGDDLTPATIGVAADCPAIQGPGGACGSPTGDLPSIVACLGCITDFEADCTGRLAVPLVASYPAECHPPSPTCQAGVVCTADADCPTGYTCRDNGGDTRYCVGASCTSDAECSGAGVCRQYCTFDGCGARLCQCPGFGCSGPADVCSDGDGTLLSSGASIGLGTDVIRANTGSIEDALDLMDGFGTTTATYFFLSGPLDPASLPASPVLAPSLADGVFCADAATATPVPVAIKPNVDTRIPNVLAVLPLPGKPLAPKTRYTCVVRRSVTGGGQPVEPSADWLSVR